jgi:3-oxoacyl-[acyl-carrier-protein] synthase-1
MQRVVVTGMGIVSSLGANCDEVLASLKNAKSGIKFDKKYAELGLRSQVSGQVAEVDSKCLIWLFLRMPVLRHNLHLNWKQSPYL